MSKAPPLRLFLDSNVLTGGILAKWGLDKAILSLCAARICRMVLAQVVREEVEENLSRHVLKFPLEEADQVLQDYDALIRLARPEIVKPPLETALARSRHLIRHAADVPVLLSAIVSRPDWLLTHNTRHFSKAVAQRTGLRIGTPREFFQTLARELTASQ